MIESVPNKEFHKQLKEINQNMLMVMLYELILGPKRKIQGIDSCFDKCLNEIQEAEESRNFLSNILVNWTQPLQN